MVICPWCGTNYTDFQSSCSRCGGPIPAPKRVDAPAREAVSDREDEVPLPPPPPRDISDNYRWKLMLADTWCQAAFVFVPLGAIFTFLGFALTVGIITAFVGLPFLGLGLVFLGGGGYLLYWRYRDIMKSVNILRNGQAVLGQVTEASTNYTVTVNGHNPLTIGYSFQAGGREYQNSLTTLNHLDLQFQPGKSVCVLYLPEAPEYSSLYPHP
jgi:hypothetical protein